MNVMNELENIQYCPQVKCSMCYITIFESYRSLIHRHKFHKDAVKLAIATNQT